MGKSVYLLGSGASAAGDYRLPTMKKLINGAMFKDHSHLTEFTERFFPGRPLEDVDFEELITFLELTDSNFSSFGDYSDPNLWHVKNELFIYLRKRLEFNLKNEPCQKLRRLFANHSREDCLDTIITLNYDLSVEHVLAVLTKKDANGKLSSQSLLARTYRLIQETIYLAGIPFSSKEEFSYYLKLHGSLNWYYCLNNNCRFHQLFFANRFENNWPEITDNCLCQLCGSRAAPVLVPPNINKSLQKFPKLSLLWNLAYREIKVADPLVVIGLSFREADYYLKWLIKSACRTAMNSGRRIEVVDQDNSLPERIKNLTGIEPHHFSSLDSYVEFVEEERAKGRR